MRTAGGPIGLRAATSQSWAEPVSWAVSRNAPSGLNARSQTGRDPKVAGRERGEGVAVRKADARVRRRRDHPAVRREPRSRRAVERPPAEEPAGGELP